MSNIPTNKQTILVKEIFSERPLKPIPVVTIKTTGPTKASKELIYKAFSKSLNLIISIAADNSMLPESNLSMIINNSAFSIISSFYPSLIKEYVLLKLYVWHKFYICLSVNKFIKAY